MSLSATSAMAAADFLGGCLTSVFGSEGGGAVIDCLETAI